MGQKQTSAASFDHLVDAREQARRQLEIMRFCGGQIDGQLKMEASYPAYSRHSLTGGALPLSRTARLK